MKNHNNLMEFTEYVLSVLLYVFDLLLTLLRLTLTIVFQILGWLFDKGTDLLSNEWFWLIVIVLLMQQQYNAKSK